jgi:hypothetical protein
MAKQIIWEMNQGDAKSRRVVVRANKYTPGGKLFFAAKRQYDNDPTDSTAVVKKDMTDDDIVETLENGDKVFLLVLASDDTNNAGITAVTDLFAEFQYVDADAKPTTYPDLKSKVEFILRLGPDVNRRRE